MYYEDRWGYSRNETTHLDGTYYIDYFQNGTLSNTNTYVIYEDGSSGKYGFLPDGTYYSKNVTYSDGSIYFYESVTDYATAESTIDANGYGNATLTYADGTVEKYVKTPYTDWNPVASLLSMLKNLKAQVFIE